MINRMRTKYLLFGLLLAGIVTTAHAIPRIIETEFGTCYYSGQSQYHWIYTCPNGAEWYVRKNTGGSGGGGNGDDGCPPNVRICE